MADPNFKKISDMAEKTTVAATDFIPIVDTLEQVDANKNKKITTANLRKDITNAELAGAITASKIAGLSTDPNADRIVFWDDGAGSLAYLTAGSGLQISDTTINAAAVSGTEIADDAIDSNHIAAGAVDLEHMSANSIDSDQYVDGSIDRVHLAADIVDGTKIADDSINSEHYVDGSIRTEHIGHAEVTSAKLGSDVGAWLDWTPTLNAGDAKLSGYDSARYCRIGKLVFFTFKAGNKAVTGSGLITISLPFVCANLCNFSAVVYPIDNTYAKVECYSNVTNLYLAKSMFNGAWVGNETNVQIRIEGFYEAI